MAVLDLSDLTEIEDARAELHRCASDGDFAAWARKWGDAAISALREFEGDSEPYDEISGEY